VLFSRFSPPRPAKKRPIFKLKRIDLLLTDIRMPGRINGWVLAGMARCRRPNLPVVYTSAYSSQPAREVENSVFLTRPYLPNDILAIVAELVAV